MSTRIPEVFETVAPTEADAQLARESSRRLATRKLGRRTSVRIQVLDDGEAAETIVVPGGLGTKNRFIVSETVPGTRPPNGYGGYLLTPAQHRPGGYETWRARSSFLEVEAETKLRAKVLELLGDLAKRKDRA